MVIYLDVILLLHQVKDDLLSDFRLVIDSLQALGFLSSWDRSMTDTKCLEYLGVVIDPVKLIFSLPTAKVEDIKSLCTKALTQPNHTRLCQDIRSMCLGNSVVFFTLIKYVELLGTSESTACRMYSITDYELRERGGFGLVSI